MQKNRVILNTIKVTNKINAEISNICGLITRNKNFFVILLVLSFLVVGTINILNHEMWADELIAWSIANTSNSIVELFENKRYEAQGLWHLCLYITTRFTDEPFTMQILHLALATGSICIFAKYSPFTKLQKVLFAFGYFPLYEYATISRSYALSIILMFSFCAFLNRKNYLLLSAILFLLAQTSMFALIIAISFGFMLIFECLVDNQTCRHVSANKKKVMVSICLFILGIVISIVQVVQPPDSKLYEWWRHESFGVERIGKMVALLWNGYVPIPEFKYHFWNTNILSVYFLQIVFSYILLCISILFFVRKKVVLFLYLMTTIGLMVFLNFSNFWMGTRHYGHFYIIFIICLWISHYYPVTAFKSKGLRKLSIFLNFNRQLFIVLLLLAHFVASVYASAMDWLYPFTYSKEVVRFIKDNKMQSMPMIGYGFFGSSMIAGYLNRTIYCPEGDRFISFPLWDNELKYVNYRKSNNAMRKMLDNEKAALLILDRFDYVFPYPIEKIKEFKGGIEKSGDLCLYLMKKPQFPEGLFDLFERVPIVKNGDFESGTLEGWYFQDNAFSGQPINGDISPWRKKIVETGFHNNFWIGTYEVHGDRAMGMMESDTFVVNVDLISFLLGGGVTQEVQLVDINGNVILRTTPHANEEYMIRRFWDVSGFHGYKCKIRVIDRSEGGWGHINVDDFVGLRHLNTE